MHKILQLLAAVIFAAMPATAAADLIMNLQLKLALSSGVDTLGLDGAMVSFDATFVDGIIYANVFGSPAAAATTHSLTISGASVASTNGTFADPDGFLYAPFVGFEGLFLDNETNYFFYRTGTIGSGLSFKFGLSLGAPPVAPNIGDFMNPSDFASAPTLFSSLEAVTDDSSVASATYEIMGQLTSSYVGSTAAIPEPSSMVSLTIATLGIAGLYRRSRRRAGC